VKFVDVVTGQESIPDSSTEGGSDPDSDSNNSYNNCDSNINVSAKHSKVKVKHFQSGVNAKGSDVVKNPQIWAHSALSEDHTVENGTTFAQLDFRLFVAGELEIILEAELPQLERRGRLILLRKMCYLFGTYDWNVVLNVYGTVLRKIEKGKATWCSDFDSTIYMILMTGGNKSRTTPLSNGPKTGSYSKKGVTTGSLVAGKKSYHDQDKTWYCPDFQHNNCSQVSPHQAIRYGKSITVHHVCAKCLMRDKRELAHADTNPSCPHFEH